MQNNDALVVPFFKEETRLNPLKSKEEGRPIYDTREIVEVRIAGNRTTVGIFPAHAMWMRDGDTEVTYAMRWQEAYGRFKAGREQVADGTPLSELTFLTKSRAAELRAMKVYTAEALASLDGKNLKSIGMDAYTLKEQATAYLERARGGAGASKMAAEIEALKAQIELMKEDAAAAGKATPEVQGDLQEPVSIVDDASEILALKEQIKALGGHLPRGRPNIDTLRSMLADLQPA